MISSTAFQASEVANTVSSFGSLLGLTNPDVNGAYSHNYFDVSAGGMIPVDFLNADTNTPLSLAYRGRVTPGGVLPGTPYRYDVDALDADGDSLTYFLINAPATMTMDATAGLINWNATESDIGTHQVVVRVEDGRGGFDTQSFVLDVEQATNRQSTIISQPVTNASPALLYTYLVKATDPDNDKLAYQFVEKVQKD